MYCASSAILGLGPTTSTPAGACPRLSGQRHRLAQTRKVAQLHALAAQCARAAIRYLASSSSARAAPGRHADLAHPPQPRPAALAAGRSGRTAMSLPCWARVAAAAWQALSAVLASATRAASSLSMRDAPLRDHLLGDLVHRGKHPADAVRRALIRHRAVGDGEMALLDVAVAVDLELDVLHPGGGAAVERLIDQRTDDVEDLAPAFAHRPAEELRMLRAEHRAIGVVVDLDVLRPPPQEHREAVGEQQAHHHAQTRRPAVRRPERRA